MTVFVDADQAHDLVTRRSITRILVMLNNTPIRWISKRQNAVETSTHRKSITGILVMLNDTKEHLFRALVDTDSSSSSSIF
jgi:hypothetical protein